MTLTPLKPLKKRLTSNFFWDHPEFSRRFMAYRLLWMMVPPQLSRLLPAGLYRALVSLLVPVPPGVDLPPGSVLPPGFTWPPGWTPGMPWPDGYIPPFWDLWDWEYWKETGILPPVYVNPFEPGPPHRRDLFSLGVWFNEFFTDMFINGWTDQSSGTGTAIFDSGSCILEGFNSGDESKVGRQDSRDVPSCISLYSKFTLDLGSGNLKYQFYQETYKIEVIFTLPTTIEIRTSSGSEILTVDDFTGTIVDFTYSARDSKGTFNWQGSDIFSDFEMYLDPGYGGQMDMTLFDAGKATITDFRVDEI